MFENINVMRMAYAMAHHAGARQSIAAQNIAHADTPGYKAQDLSAFSEMYLAQTPLKATRGGHLGISSSHEWRIVEPSLPHSANGNSVSLETEMFRSIDIKRQHDRALTIYQHSMDVLRTSLGRG